MCVTEGAGPLLWLCVLPSGARQIFEERILPEGQCQTAGGLNAAGDRKLKHEQGSSTQCTVLKNLREIMLPVTTIGLIMVLSDFFSLHISEIKWFQQHLLVMILGLQ